MQSLAGQQHNIFIMYSTDLTKNGQDYFSQSSATDFSPKIVNVSDLCLKNNFAVNCHMTKSAKSADR